MMRRTLLMLIVSFAMLAFSPARGEMSISANTSLDSFSYDLDSIHLKLEKLEARWQLSPLGDGKLLIEKMQAKRLIITMRDEPKNSNSSGLPDRIKPPFPIKIQQADIAEVIIISTDKTQTFNHVKFDLEADTKSIRLNQLNATTPLGETAVTLTMSTAKPFSLNGTASLKQTGNNKPYDVLAKLSGDLQTVHFESTAVLAKQADKFIIHQANKEKNSSAARIVVHGQLSLTDDYPLTFKANITEFQSERLGNYPAATINLEVNAQGKLLPEALLDIQFTTHDSLWQKRALVSSGKLLIEGSSISNIDLQAAIGNNIIKAQGSLGKLDSKLEWSATLADLAKFGADYSGVASAKGTLSGTFDNLGLQFNLSAQKLYLAGDIKLENLEGQAIITPEENGKVVGELKVSALQYGKNLPIDGQISLNGARNKHLLNIAAQGQSFKLSSQLQGSLSPLNKWQGMLQSLDLTGVSPIKLTAPAMLIIDKNNVNLEKATLQLAKGSAVIDSLTIGANTFSSKGHIDQLALQDLPVTLWPASLKGNVLFSGNWDVNAAEEVNGKLSLWRETGDLSMTASDGIIKPLGLETLKADVIIINNQATITANINGLGIGNLEANISTALSKTDTGFALLSNASLTINGKAQLHSLAWLPLPVSLMAANINGELALSVSGNGTMQAPNLSGNISAKNLLFTLPTEGVALSEGSLEASFEHDKLLINLATWKGGEGYLKSSGLIALSQGKPTIDLDWTADKFTAISRADRLLILSGSGRSTLAESMLAISGDFTVNKGLIELVNEDAPTLGDDVVILGLAESSPESTQEQALKLLLNGLHVNLGEAFKLRGRGLDAELTGALTLTGLTQYHPHTEGGIQVVKGTYMAYGQILTIERGILNFSGTLENPGINIRAMRNSTPINAGIELTGSAFSPITKLVSVPNIADSEKLSWLLLGHGMDQTTKNDYGILSLAAGVVLSQGQSVPLQTQIARAAGLDELSFSGGNATSASLVFGKRLSSKLYLSYVKSISGLLDVARLTFNITPLWSIRAAAGTESAVDVLYTFSFK